jgi:hypothetical protein
LLVLLVHRSYAQEPDTIGSRDPAGIVVLTDAAFVVPSSLLLLWVHESGHAAFALAGGAEDVRIGLYRETGKGETQLGWATWRANSLSSFGTALAHAGGVMFSRGWAEGSHALVKNVPLPGWGQRFFSMMFMMSRLDFPRYVLQDAILNLIEVRGSDIDGLVTEIAGRYTGMRTLTYLVLLGIATVDLVFDWDRIRLHWSILGGEHYNGDEGGQQHRVTVRPILTYCGVGMSLNVAF